MRCRQLVAVARMPALLLVVLIGAACASPPQRQLSEPQLLQGQDAFVERYESDLATMEMTSEARIRQELQGVSDGSGPRQSYDLLILSGGGAFGAFGAGFLSGWGEVTDEEFSRPQFDTVSGISTGALIAPFAFLGTTDAYDAIVELYENPGQDWVREKGLLALIQGDPALYDVSKLQDRIKKVVTPDLANALALESDKNRQLLVGATNADYGQMRVWDLARVSRVSAIDEAVALIASVLQASTAIPGAFPPIIIDNNLYVDGGATMQVVGGIENREWAYVPNADTPDFSPDKSIRIRIWIIVNQKLRPEPSVVALNWATIMTRSAETLIRTSTLQSIRDAESYARIIDQLPGFEATMRYVGIPQDYSIPESATMFDPATMRQLVKLGRSMGSDPASWMTESLRPGAPSE